MTDPSRRVLPEMMRSWRATPAVKHLPIPHASSVSFEHIFQDWRCGENSNPTDYQDFSSTQVNNFLRYNHRRFPLHVPENKNDLFGRTTLIWCHFRKMKSVRTETNEITGPEENSTSCEMMFSDHLNETGEKAIYERRLSCVRACDMHVCWI